MITRSELVMTLEKIKDYYGGDVFNKLLDNIETCKNCDYYILQYVNETVLIYDTTTDFYISWYKLTHIGRALHTNIEDEQHLHDFFDYLFSVIEEV